MVASRSGPWLTVRAPAVYGPGDRETLAYFKAVARGLAPRPQVADARLSLIHVADLAEALALALDQPPPPSTYEIDDGRDGGYSYRDMADAAGRALGRRPLSLAVPRAVMAAMARVNAIGHSLGGPVQILTPGKVDEIFHSDWTAHDRRLAAALGWHPRVRPGNRLRRDDLVVPPAGMALELVKYGVTNCHFTRNCPFWHSCVVFPRDPWSRFCALPMN